MLWYHSLVMDEEYQKCSIYDFFNFKQTVEPEEIVLWLDYDNWNKDNLPFSLRRMIEWKRLKVMFCKDIRSYTKLIPALEEYSDKAIVTVDDDVYYSSNLIYGLYKQYVLFPNKILFYYSYTYSYKNGYKCTFPIGERSFYILKKCWMKWCLMSNFVQNYVLFWMICGSMSWRGYQVRISYLFLK